MKKTLLTFCFALFGVFMFAQTSYEKSLNEKAKQASTAKTVTDYDKLFNEFSDLTRGNDPYRWKAYYYAGLMLYNQANVMLTSNKKSDITNINGLAEKYVLGSLSFQPDDKESNDLLNLIREQRKPATSQTILANKK